MKKYSFCKQLASYSALATSLIAVSKDSEAQILYTDVTPDDTLLMCDTFALDLNHDGIVDFVLQVNKHVFSYWYGCEIMDKGVENAVAGVLQASYYTQSATNSQGYFRLPYKLRLNDHVGASLHWVKPLDFNRFHSCEWDVVYPWHSQAILNFYYSDAYSGNWKHSFHDGYLGLKTIINGQPYYGWARLVVDPNAKQMIIKDYAIQTIPDESILAGEGFATNTSPVIISDAISLSPNPASDYFKLSLPDQSEALRLVLINALGDRTNIPFIKNGNSVVADISDISTGIYLVEVKFKTGIVRKKIVIE